MWLSEFIPALVSALTPALTPRSPTLALLSYEELGLEEPTALTLFNLSVSEVEKGSPRCGWVKDLSSDAGQVLSCPGLNMYGYKL